MLPPLKTAIVGAGPAGLTLGILLHKRNIPYTIYELRSKITDEELAQPVGSLDLHEETGLAALRECGLLEKFDSLQGDTTEAQVIADKQGNIIYNDEGSGTRPEIARHKLTKLLLDHLPPSSIKWNHKLFSASSQISKGRPRVELDFGSNGKHIFDLVVGSDGAWSRVRAMLSDVKPVYSNSHLSNINIRNLTTKYPHLAQLVGTGSFTVLANGHGVMAQRSVNNSARVYVFISTKEENFATTTGLNSMTPIEAKDVLLARNDLLGEWGTNIKELVTAACEDDAAYDPTMKFDFKPLYSLPVGHRWPHNPCATVIGDAAHLINPGAGEGVNSAMLDALNLSHAIIKAHDAAGQDSTKLRDMLSHEIQKFEVNMVAEAVESAKGTLEVSKLMFGGENGSEDMAAWFKSFMPPPI